MASLRRSMMETEPRAVGDVPPDRRTEEKPQGADPDTERDLETEEPSPEPPPESSPGQEGVPNPKQ
jgi:hypothetical protein